MVKIVDLSDLGEIKSQEQIDSLTKQCVVGEPLLNYESLNIGTDNIDLDFQTGIVHQIIESLSIQLYQLQDESDEKPENEEEVKAYCIKAISNNLRLLKFKIDDNLQSMLLLLEAYLKENHVPEILTTAFVLCSLDVDNQTNPIDLTIDRFIEHYKKHSEVFVQAMKHAWNPILDEQLKKKIDGIEDSAFKTDIEDILRFRKDKGEANHFEELMH